MDKIFARVSAWPLHIVPDQSAGLWKQVSLAQGGAGPASCNHAVGEQSSFVKKWTIYRQES